MNNMTQALVRAGFKLPHIRFASACYDLARLVLNREPNTQRAVSRWHGMAHMPGFEEALLAFLIAVQQDMQPSGAGDDQLTGVETDHATSVAPVPDPLSADEDQGLVVHLDHQKHVSSAEPPVMEDEDHQLRAQQSHTVTVPPSVTPAQQRAALKNTRLQSAYLLTDPSGVAIAIEDFAVRRIEPYMEQLANRAVKNAADLIVLRNIRQRAPQVTDNFITVGECMHPDQIREAVASAKQQAILAAKATDRMMANLVVREFASDVRN